MAVHAERPQRAIHPPTRRVMPMSQVVAIAVIAAMLGAVVAGLGVMLVSRSGQSGVSELNAELAAAEERSEADAAEISALTAERDELQGTVGDLEGTITGLRGNVGELEGTINQLRATVDDLRASGGSATSEVENLEDANAALQTQVNELTASLEEVQVENTTLQQQLESYNVPWVPVWPTVTLGSALKHGTDWFTAGEYLLVVDVAVKNSNAESVYFGPWDFKLKGPDNTVYSLVMESAVSSRFPTGVSPLPDGRTEIRGQEVRPGEEIRGSLVFYITNSSVTDFTITYHGEETTKLTAS